MWPDDRLTTLLGIRVPIIQAPMAGAGDSALAAAVCVAGALGSLPCAMLRLDAIRAEVAAIRKTDSGPTESEFLLPYHRWRTMRSSRLSGLATRTLLPRNLAFPMEMRPPGPARAPFAEEACALVEELRPEVVSFHFGLPEAGLLKRVKASGAVVLEFRHHGRRGTMARGAWL